jgi:hypothetical protein
MKLKSPSIFYNKQRNKWVVDLRPHGGKRECKYKTKALAESRAAIYFARVRTLGEQPVDLSTEDLIDAKRGIEILREHKVDLHKAAQFYAQHLKDRSELAAFTLAEASGKWIGFKSRGQIKAVTLCNYRTRINSFVESFGKKRLSDITHDQIHKWLYELEGSNTTRNDYCAVLSSFYSWCISQKWLRDNPAKGIHFKVADKEVQILSVEEARELYKAAKESDPDVLRYVILCMFVGLRPRAEAVKVIKEDISLNGNIRVHSGKTGRLRYVRLEEGVLQSLWNTSWPGGTYQTNFRRRWDELRYKLGYRVWLDPKYAIPERPKGIKLKHWPHDVLRHTYCSYHLAAFENEALTVHCAGHDFRMFRKHYKRPIPKSEGVKFWSILSE